MRTFYDIVECLEEIKSADPKLPLETVLAKNRYSVNVPDYRLRLINMFNAALEEVHLIPHLPETEIQQMVATVRSIQNDCFLALCRANVNEFNSVIKVGASISTLRLIGHTVSGIQAPTPVAVVREELVSDVHQWISEIDQSDLPPLQKAIILAKLRSLFRFLADCSGATDDQIRRRVKSLADDLSKDIACIADQNKPMIQRLTDRLREPLRGTPAAIGLLADVVSLAPFVGVAGLALLQQTPPLPQLQSPSHYAAEHEATDVATDP